jgi:hypothetical protein
MKKLMLVLLLLKALNSFGQIQIGTQQNTNVKKPLQVVTGTLKVICGADGELSVDGESQGDVSEGEIKKLSVKASSDLIVQLKPTDGRKTVRIIVNVSQGKEEAIELDTDGNSEVKYNASLLLETTMDAKVLINNKIRGYISAGNPEVFGVQAGTNIVEVQSVSGDLYIGEGEEPYYSLKETIDFKSSNQSYKIFDLLKLKEIEEEIERKKEEAELEEKRKKEEAKQAEKNNFTNAERKRSSLEMESYLSKYPNGSNVSEAKSYIPVFKEEEFWNKADKSASSELLWQYLDKYPNGKFRVQAQTKIKDYDDKAWKLAQNANSIDSYQNYLKNYPSGAYRILAVKSLETVKDIALKKYNKEQYEIHMNAYLSYKSKAKLNMFSGVIFTGFFSAGLVLGGISAYKFIDGQSQSGLYMGLGLGGFFGGLFGLAQEPFSSYRSDKANARNSKSEAQKYKYF